MVRAFEITDDKGKSLGVEEWSDKKNKFNEFIESLKIKYGLKIKFKFRYFISD